MPLPTPMPNRSMAPADYISSWNALLAYLPTFESDMNQAAANAGVSIGGTAFAIPYIFSTTTSAGDPGLGLLRFNNASQAASTTLYLDLFGANNVDYTAMIDHFGTSSSSIKGQIRVVKVGDASKWATWNITAVNTVTGYRSLSVTPVAASATLFNNNDQVVLMFTRTGDIGPAGTINRRVTTLTTASAPVVDMNNFDALVITALSDTCTFGAPTGTLTDLRQLMIRVKDSGTPRTFLWNAVFRGSTELPLPSGTTAGKTTYMGFTYNSADTKWDLLGVNVI